LKHREVKMTLEELHKYIGQDVPMDPKAQVLICTNGINYYDLKSVRYYKDLVNDKNYLHLTDAKEETE
jgi:hypothetical protein